MSDPVFPARTTLAPVEAERFVSARVASRRAVLRLGLAGAGAGLLAACGAGSSPSPTTPSGLSTASSSGTNPSPTPSPLAGVTSGGGPAAVASGASEKTLAAANAFLASLDGPQRTAAVAERTQTNLSQWSNLPDQLYKRAGLRMDKLGGEQQKAVLAILAAALSLEGYAQATQVTTADGVLAASGGMNLDFGADHYWIRFVGAPPASTQTTNPWTIQYGGHHLALNITVAGSKMTMAPTLWGSQPAFFTQNGSTIEPLNGETAEAYAVMAALDGAQQKAAILPTAVTEIVLGAGQDGKTLTPAGVVASAMTSAQKQLLLALHQEWLRPLNGDHAAERLAAADAELDQTRFAWYGGTAAGSPIYYRIQSPSEVIEFAHQQGGGANSGGVTHIHSIYREIGNDYGVKL